MEFMLFFLRDLSKHDSEAESFGNGKDNFAVGVVYGGFGRLLRPVTLFLLGLRRCFQLVIISV